jgi:UDP-N-acetylmuramoylalanine--D-glutamate ligase
MAGYLAAKLRLFARQTRDDVAILSADCPVTRALRDDQFAARVWRFSARGPVERGACYDAGALLIRLESGIHRFALDSLPPLEGPQRSNALAALLAVAALGADPARALGALASSRALRWLRSQTCRGRCSGSSAARTRASTSPSCSRRRSGA